MRRRRTNNDRPREKRTLIPPFDPAALAKEIELEANRPTAAPPFEASAYARIVDAHVSVARAMAAERASEASEALDGEQRTAPTLTAVTPLAPPPIAGSASDETVDLENVETIGREMYGCYLASDFPEALVLAERVLERQPEHALAQLVHKQCMERLQPSARALSPSSVLRLKFAELERHSNEIDPTSSFVLGHIDGISDAATVAALTGLPDAEALERLHVLLNLGVLEVVRA